MIYRLRSKHQVISKSKTTLKAIQYTDIEAMHLSCNFFLHKIHDTWPTVYMTREHEKEKFQAFYSCTNVKKYEKVKVLHYTTKCINLQTTECEDSVKKVGQIKMKVKNSYLNISDVWKQTAWKYSWGPVSGFGTWTLQKYQKCDFPHGLLVQ